MLHTRASATVSAQAGRGLRRGSWCGARAEQGRQGDFAEADAAFPEEMAAGGLLQGLAGLSCSIACVLPSGYRLVQVQHGAAERGPGGGLDVLGAGSFTVGQGAHLVAGPRRAGPAASSQASMVSTSTVSGSRGRAGKRARRRCSGPAGYPPEGFRHGARIP